MNRLNKLAKPLIKLLQDSGSPTLRIVISDTGAEIVDARVSLNYRGRIADLIEERNRYHRLFCFSVTFAATMLLCCVAAICFMLIMAGR